MARCGARECRRSWSASPSVRSRRATRRPLRTRRPSRSTPTGRIVVAGYSRSTDYPLQDAVISIVAGNALDFSSYLDGALIVVGETVSTDFPATSGANLPGRDGFVTILRAE